MTADTITIERLDDLLAALDTARATVHQIYIDSLRGDSLTAEAAAIVNETVAHISSFAK